MRGQLSQPGQAQILGEGRQKQLEEALASKSAEVNGLVEAQDDLRRSMEEMQSARLEVEASMEVQTVELEALRLEVQDLRSRANPAIEKAPGNGLELVGREAFALAFGGITAGLPEAEIAGTSRHETTSIMEMTALGICRCTPPQMAQTLAVEL
eukprot:UN5066